jgi:predicted NBD/HSP70 family sugar kinase
VVEHTARQLGLAIATVCAVIDPELVVLGGRIGRSPDLLPGVRAAVGRLLPFPTRIESSVLAERAALEGALAFGLRAARERLFSRGF